MELMEHMEHMEHRTQTGSDQLVELPTSMPFGKYQDWPISELIENPKYVRWLLSDKYIRLGVALAQQPWIDEFLKG